MDSQFVSGTLKTTVSLLLMGVIWLLISALAESEVPTTEGQVQQLDEVPIPQGTIDQLEGVETRSSFSSPLSVGGSLSDDSENESFKLELTYEPEYSFFGLEVRVNPSGEDWLSLNQGEGPRGYSEIILVRF